MYQRAFCIQVEPMPGSFSKPARKVEGMVSDLNPNEFTVSMPRVRAKAANIWSLR
jgi:hypothetical protein